MLTHFTGQGKHPRLAPEIEKPIQLELIIMLFGEGHTSTGDEERRFFPKGRGLDFDEALLPIGFERQDVETHAVALSLGHMLHLVGERVQSQGTQAVVLEIQGESFARCARRGIS